MHLVYSRVEHFPRGGLTAREYFQKRPHCPWFNRTKAAQRVPLTENPIFFLTFCSAKVSKFWQVLWDDLDLSINNCEANHPLVDLFLVMRPHDDLGLAPSTDGSVFLHICALLRVTMYDTNQKTENIGIIAIVQIANVLIVQRTGLSGEKVIWLVHIQISLCRSKIYISNYTLFVPQR
ncbi:hypothetical protein HYPSUDRAFT_788482 [Hypholoma sublateritium FD-334 SS-4]|uniref:Uncharacterized protein n=1 Tax=Hypholoma sublateritium (strain FD-334 SS-4) TaxID=945553 RepID=A0A0D2MB24_HYPSF|nr:hypothetical protein HYPSUDRAFT_788482 [Hypholoma sublateritium FD-334 SS-4]